jgi:hypothetical protein
VLLAITLAALLVAAVSACAALVYVAVFLWDLRLRPNPVTPFNLALINTPLALCAGNLFPVALTDQGGADRLLTVCLLVTTGSALVPVLHRLIQLGERLSVTPLPGALFIGTRYRGSWTAAELSALVCVGGSILVSSIAPTGPTFQSIALALTHLSVLTALNLITNRIDMHRWA